MKNAPHKNEIHTKLRFFKVGEFKNQIRNGLTVLLYVASFSTTSLAQSNQIPLLSLNPSSQQNPAVTTQGSQVVTMPHSSMPPIHRLTTLKMPPLRRLSAPVKYNNSPYVWTLNGLREFNGLMNNVSMDLDSFFKKNPDFIADNLGGNAYNAWGALKKTMNDLLQNANFQKTYEIAKDYWLSSFFGGNPPLLPEKGVEENLCATPRVCQSIQYLVAASILEYWNPNANSDLAFYTAMKDDKKHSFIVVLPAGLDPTVENVRSQGFIIDPFYSQSSEPSKFLIRGDDEKYSKMEVSRYKLNREELEFAFGKNPLDVESPTSPPEPPPSPSPSFCNTFPYQVDSRGLLVYGANGNPIAASDLVGTMIVTLVKSSNIFAGGTVNVLAVKCDWEKNGASYINYAEQYIKQLPKSNSLKYCLGTFTVPKDAVMPDVYSRPETIKLSMIAGSCNE